MFNQSEPVHQPSKILSQHQKISRDALNNRFIFRDTDKSLAVDIATFLTKHSVSILKGPPGSAKTSIAHLAAMHLHNFTIHEMDCSGHSQYELSLRQLAQCL